MGQTSPQKIRVMSKGENLPLFVGFIKCGGEFGLSIPQQVRMAVTHIGGSFFKGTPHENPEDQWTSSDLLCWLHSL